VGAVLATQWTAVRHLNDPLSGPVRSVLFDPVGQLACLAVAVLAALWIVRRHDRFDFEQSGRQP
jgi:hypothetical protein